MLRDSEPVTVAEGVELVGVPLTTNQPDRDVVADSIAAYLPRQRVQEITEQLEVDAPVYVVFTKAAYDSFVAAASGSKQEDAK